MRSAAVTALAAALAASGAGRASAQTATIGSAAAASGLYYGAALDLEACRATRRCVGVTTWGLTDNRSWAPSFSSGYGAALPFDADYRPKPAAAAMTRALAGP
jgi:GH35 family endo-1,4-beta-xylanase